MRRRLIDLAHARAGDKGDTSTICLFPYEPALYADLVREVTAERVRSHLGEPRSWRGHEVRASKPAGAPLRV